MCVPHHLLIGCIFCREKKSARRGNRGYMEIFMDCVLTMWAFHLGLLFELLDLPYYLRSANNLATPSQERFMSDSEQEGKTSFDVIVQAATELSVDSLGLPKALRRNVGKVLEYLVKIPKSIIDANVAERQAISDARVANIKATGKVMVEGAVVDDKLIEIAHETNARRIARQQKNAIGVLSVAVDELRKEQFLGDEPPAEISEDWLNAFERDAILMSSEEMQLLFGKILAGEIREPGSFSKRTVALMAEVGPKQAALFQRFCSMTTELGRVDHSVDARVISIGEGLATNELSKYGLSYSALCELTEYGLVSTEYSSSAKYGTAIANEEGRVVYSVQFGSKHHALQLKDESQRDAKRDFTVSGAMLTAAGKELLQIVDRQVNSEYFDELVKYFDEQGFRLLPF